MLKFYALPQSPYCAKVRAALVFKDMPFDELEPHGGSYQTTAFQTLVPAGSVPAIAEDNWLLHDSQAILEYLEECRPTPSIWSRDRRQRAIQRSIMHFHDTRLEPKARELVPLVKRLDSAERVLEIGVVRDNLFDRLYRLVRLMQLDITSMPSPMSAVDWTLPPTIYMAEDILSHLGSSLNMPEKMQEWLNQVVKTPLVSDQVDCVRGAIAQWLRNESSLNNHS